MHHHPSTIGFPRETGSRERRTLLTPHLAHALTDAGFRLVAEPGIGDGIGVNDADLPGVEFRPADRVWTAPLVLRYKPGPPTDLAHLHRGQAVGAIFHAEGDPDMITALAQSEVKAFSYEFLHEHGRFPLAMAGGQIAGVQAVHLGTHALQHPQGRGVLLGGVDGAEPARVVVIGNGNVGTAAAATAARLGADVTILTRTSRTAATYERQAPPGVHVAVNTPDRLTELLANADLVIGAILISTHTTPPMITRAHLATMRPGAVIVDATCGYGDGYLPTAGPVQNSGDPPRVVDGIVHVKVDVLPRLVPMTASHAYTRAAAPYLVRLARHVLHGVKDPGAESALIADKGALVHPVVREHADRYQAGAAA
ncbi:NAD(P)-dependent oxidoreductase [Nocardiopsis sp. LOL_012]|uniref:NAD(P)-dependent oxidoreductase n=1 Tax=Nocardiopsis sp. LOL_012 TaxID=3345409 RepID=UPI003A83D6F0